MAQSARQLERRAELLPILARAFAELGYRRATTAELARRCGVRENILYRIWPDKKAMFLAALDQVFDSSLAVWHELLGSDGAGTSAERLLAHESQHHGEHGLYRIVFTSLGETDDPDVRRALRGLYRRYQRFVAEHVRVHHEANPRRGDGNAGGDGVDAGALPPDVAAWAIIGLGTVTSITRELGLLPAGERSALMEQTGRLLLGRGG